MTTERQRACAVCRRIVFCCGDGGKPVYCSEECVEIEAVDDEKRERETRLAPAAALKRTP
jgi:hypothetical protein